MSTSKRKLQLATLSISFFTLGNFSWAETPQNLPSGAPIYDFQLDLSDRVVNRLAQEPIAQTGPILTETQEGLLTGNAAINGNVTAVLVPNSQVATFDLRLTANMNTSTMLSAQPRCDIGVNLCSSSSSCVNGCRRVEFRPDGFWLYNGGVTASTVAQLNGVNVAATGLFRRIKGAIASNEATQQFYQRRGQTEAEISERARTEVLPAFEARSRETLAKASTEYRDKIYNKIIAPHKIRGTVRTATTSRWLQVYTVRPLAAGESPQPADVKRNSYPTDLKLQLHETVVNEYLAMEYAGKKIPSDQLARDIQMAKTPAPSAVVAPRNAAPTPISDAGENDKWTIQFAERDPLKVSFADDGMRLEINAVSMSSDDDDIPALQIVVDFKIAHDPSGNRWQMERSETITVKLADASDSNSESRVALGVVRGRMKRLIPAATSLNSLALPGDLMKTGGLSTGDLTMQNGWMVYRAFLSPTTQYQGDVYAQASR